MASYDSVSRNTRLILSSALLLIVACATQASPVFRPSKCPVCTDADRAKCPPLPSSDCEVIEEPNCGCCKMCAKKVGEKCGVATGLCETGLECIPPPMTEEEYRDYGPANYFMEAVMGEFICVTKQQFIDILTGVAYDDDIEVGEGVIVPELYQPDINGNGIEIPSVEAPSEGPSYIPASASTEDMSSLNPFRPAQPELVVVEERPTRPMSSPFKNAPEPCVYHADKVWGKEHFDKHEWIPSCETDGSYFPEQCELSFGLERGRCWCVDRHGNPTTDFVPGEEARPEMCLTRIEKA